MRRVAGPVVGLGPVGARADDGLERVAGGAEPADLGVELEAELLLGEPVEQAVAHVGERGVGDRRGRLDAGHLAVVLDQPQVVDQPGGRHQLDVGEPARRRTSAAGPR